MKKDLITAIATVLATGLAAAIAAEATDKRKEGANEVYKIPGNGLNINVVVGFREIIIEPQIYRDGNQMDEFTRERISEIKSFPPEKIRRAWYNVEHSDIYKQDDEYALRMRQAFNFAKRTFKRKYGDILS